MKTLTTKQEKFCINYFKTGKATQSAIDAGYSPKTSDVIASENLTKPAVLARMAELRGKVATAAIMSVQERKERLSEIARTNLTQFMELGADGSWVNLGAETPNAGAIQEIHSRTEYDKDSNAPTIYTSVKLHDPLKAIDLLNKMDGVYDDAVKISIDNRKQTVILTAKDLTDDELASIAAGGRNRITTPPPSKSTPDRLHTVHAPVILEPITSTEVGAEAGRSGSGQGQESNCDNAATTSKE